MYKYNNPPERVLPPETPPPAPPRNKGYGDCRLFNCPKCGRDYLENPEKGEFGCPCEKGESMVQSVNQKTNQNASIRIVLTNEWGDQTDITKTLTCGTMHEIYPAIRDALLGCGFGQKTIDEWFPEE